MLASLRPATPCAGGWAAGAMNDEWTQILNRMGTRNQRCSADFQALQSLVLSQTI